MALTLIVTNAGRAALLNAANTGTAAVTIAAVGISATAVTPSATATGLPGEIKRIATLSGDVVADDTIHLVVRDESSAVFTVRSFALYLADGTLFAIYGQTGVILEKSAQAIMLLAIDVRFADVAASQLTFGNANFLNPPATTEQIGVIELATIAEAKAGIDALRALTPAAAQAAILGWLLGQDGAGSGLDADMLDGRQLGTSGDAVPSLAGANTWTGQQTITTMLRSVFPGTRGGPLGGVEFYNGSEINNWFAGMRAYCPDNSPGINFAELRFYTTNGGPGEKMRLSAGGRLGLGTTAPEALLHVAGDGYISTSLRIAEGTAWHSANDGAGSALDADLLDGLQGAEYGALVRTQTWSGSNTFTQPITGSVTGFASGLGLRDSRAVNTPPGGYTAGVRFDFKEAGVIGNTFAGDTYCAVMQVNPWVDMSGSPSQVAFGNNLAFRSAASSTAWNAWRLVWDSANDGAGSGLDADLLDGQQGSYYADIAARLGYTPVRQGTGIGQVSRNVVHIGWSNTRVKVTIDNVDMGNVVFDNHIADVWRASNDGAGSGLDADLLDGREGSYYADIASRLGYTPANKAGDTFTGAVALAAGRNLDLLPDGARGGVRLVSGSAARTGWIEFIMPDGTRMGYLGWGSATGPIEYRNDVNGGHAFNGGQIARDGGKVWDAGNDGAGSGLDADLLDGKDWNGGQNVTFGVGAFNGDVTLRSGADLRLGSQNPGNPDSLIYNDRGTIGMYSNGYERVLISQSGEVHIKGQRQYGNETAIPGSGNLRVFAATPGGYALETFDFQNYWPAQFVRDISGTAAMVGGISCTDFSTTFVTSSDYRLKEDLRPVHDPLARLNALKVWDFRWIGTDRRTDGFMAHELAELIPDAVTGERDGMRDVEVEIEPAVHDEEGKVITPAVTRTDRLPAYQGVDQSKVVPLLVAAVQALTAKVKALEARQAA